MTNNYHRRTCWQEMTNNYHSRICWQKKWQIIIIAEFVDKKMTNNYHRRICCQEMIVILKLIDIKYSAQYSVEHIIFY